MRALRAVIPVLTSLTLVVCAPALIVLSQWEKQESLRQAGLITSREIASLSTRISELRTNEVPPILPEELVWFATKRQDAELELQRYVNSAATDWEIEVRSFHSTKVSSSKVETIAFTMEAEGTLDSIYRFLAEIEQQSPRIAVKSFRLRTSRKVGATSASILMSFQITFWAFWNGEP